MPYRARYDLCGERILEINLVGPMPQPQAKRIVARFYVEPGSEPPSEPVREWLRRLPDEDKKEIGLDIMVIEMS